MKKIFHFAAIVTAIALVFISCEGNSPDNGNNNNANNNNGNKSVGSILSERVATGIADAMTRIITKGLDRQPTIVVKPGYRFMIFVQHDIVFPRTWSVARGH